MKVLSIITFRTGLKTTFQKMIYFDLLFICTMIKQKLLKLNVRISFKLELLMPFDSLKLTFDSTYIYDEVYKLEHV